MGFWTLGPVLGSLVVTEVSSHTLASHPDWRYQFYVCGIAGLVVAVIALVGLRELSPRLRDQLMVSMRDRALIEARAAGIDPETALRGHWRQMLRFDIVGSAFAISVFLLLYYILVAFLVVYFATVFGYSEQRANSLANWYWITNAIALLIAGVLSDKVRVRKPFMVVGAVISMFGTILFALAATHPHTSYYTFAVYFILSAAGGGMAYVAWMAAFTETVEKHNPAATATGLAVWGWVLRLIVTGAFALLTVIVPATTALVDQGPRVESIVAKYPTQVKVLQTVDPVTLGALNTNPNDQAAQVKALSELTKLPALDVVRVVTLGAKLRAGAPLPASDMAFLAANGPKVQASATALQSVSQVPPADLAYLSAHGSKVAKAQTDNPKQWQRWWWISLAGQAIFLPFVFVLAGRWSPRRAREDEIAHERMVEQELAQMGAHSPLAGGMTRAAPDEPRTRRDVT
jgi:MFS transporter, ACS family, D-galactonate transporter